MEILVTLTSLEKDTGCRFESYAKIRFSPKLIASWGMYSHIDKTAKVEAGYSVVWLHCRARSWEHITCALNSYTDSLLLFILILKFFPSSGYVVQVLGVTVSLLVAWWKALVRLSQDLGGDEIPWNKYDFYCCSLVSYYNLIEVFEASYFNHLCINVLFFLI